MDSKSKLTNIEFNKIIKKYKFNSTDEIISFLSNHKNDYSFFDLSKIAENANQLRVENSAYYTDEELLKLIKDDLPEFSEKNNLKILEPSVGIGNFLPILFDKYSNKNLLIDVVDIDKDSLKILKTLMQLYNVPKSVKINYICSDFCNLNISNHYDLVVGNPPFSKVKKTYLDSLEKKYFFNFDSNNLASYFYEKCCIVSDYVCLVMPKNLLNTPEYSKTRDFLKNKRVESIIDFGEKGFKGVLVETIYLKTDNLNKPNFTYVSSITKNINIKQKQNYIFDEKLPYWVIYRNDFFDSFTANLEFGIFNVFRDRQITSKLTNKYGNGIRIIKSRNISNDGQFINDLSGYDEYIPTETATKLSVYRFLNDDNVYLTPNMTYNTRVMKKPNGVLINGSVAVLVPKKNVQLNEKQLLFFSSKEYRDFMQIARNYQTRTLNIDKTSVYFFGIRRE